MDKNATSWEVIDGVSRNYRIWSRPSDADPNRQAFVRMYPGEKMKYGKGLNFKEDAEFRGICEYGSEQLIPCYGDDGLNNEGYSRSDFCKMCKHCPHALRPKDGFDPFYRSMFDGFYVYDRLSKYIAEDLEDSNLSFVYFISDGQFVKIGKADNVISRIKTLQTACPRKLEILYEIPANNYRDAYTIERLLHGLYSRYRTYGEWFDILEKIDKKSFDAVFCGVKEEL